MRSDHQFEFGDFQTPMKTAQAVIEYLYGRGVRPKSIIEPTCGLGNFLSSAAQHYPDVEHVFGVEINSEYAAEAKRRVPNASVIVENFFDYDWSSLLQSLPEPILIVGNPPWVTSSGLSSRGGSNLPPKSNFHGHRGLDAKTGKANFDIAEWIVLRLIEEAKDREVIVAVLLKTAVARKVLRYLWKGMKPVRMASIIEIDAMQHFGVSAAACLLVCDLGKGDCTSTCEVFDSFCSREANYHIGWENGQLIADAEAHSATRHLEAWPGSFNGSIRWRSGVKHDCSKVVEFREIDGELVNGLDEVVDLEEAFVYPLLKGSDVANHRASTRKMLITQRRTGEDTESLKHIAPKVWEYLVSHGDYFDRRGSSIYRNRPRFSIFGIGDYTFKPWKIAICGLYKSLNFRVVGPSDDRPVVFDDTCYLLPFNEEAEARETAELLQSEEAIQYFKAYVFWDNKRPITAELLNRLDIRKLGGYQNEIAESLYG